MPFERFDPINSDNEQEVSWHIKRYSCAAKFTSGSVLDAACGFGYGSQILNYNWYIGKDKNQECIQIAKERYINEFPSIVFLCEDIEAIDILPYDSAVVIETLEHLHDPEKFIKRLREKIKNCIFVSFPVVRTTQNNPFHLHDLKIDIVDKWMGEWHKEFGVYKCNNRIYMASYRKT